MIKAIFWDNDGVLVGTEKYYFEATPIVLRSFGIDLSQEAYIENYLINNRGCWHLLPNGNGNAAMIEELRKERNQLYQHFIQNEDIAIKGVKEVLAALYGKVNMAVVSSSRKDHFEMIHAKTGFMNYLDFAILNEDYTNSKPDPEPYLKAIEKTGLHPENCMAVEDSIRGLNSAKAASLKCYIVPTDLTSGNDFSEADGVFNDISEVLHMFNH